MAVIIGIIGSMYIGNEISNTIKDIVKFDYRKYFENKVSNMSVKCKIKTLEIELNANQKQYNYYNNQYRNIFKEKNFNSKNLDNIRKTRDKYYKICQELRNLIKENKDKIIY